MSNALTQLENGEPREATLLVERYEQLGDQQRSLLDGLAGEAARQPSDETTASPSAASPSALELLLLLVERHRLAIPAIRRIVADDNTVEEIGHDTLVAVATSITSFQGSAGFRTWLNAVATNQTKQFLRSQSRRPIPSGGQPADINWNQQTVSLRLSSLVARRQSLDEAIAQLPQHYRDAVLLRDVDQLPYADIANQLGIDVNTVRSRIHRGRALLARTFIQGQADTPDLAGTDDQPDH